MINVRKRDGSMEQLDLNKFHRVCEHACAGLAGVSVSSIELRSHIQFFDGITTKQIHETLIKAAADLITEDTPNYQYVASRLINYGLRKEVYERPEPWSLKRLIEENINDDAYDPDILNWYDDEELDRLDKSIVHDRDYNIVYAGMEQFRGKYLVKNRVTGRFYETPQMAYMLIAMVLFRTYPKNIRLRWVKDYYDAISNFEISLPTPIMAGLRTKQKQFSSCVLIECDDSLDSIIATSGSIIKYVSQKAGIGIGAGKIRAIGSKVRGGDATSEGVIPYYKLFQSSVKSCSQGGVRGGSATIHYPIWHLEVEDLLVLKNNKGVEENRVRHMDYCVQFNRLMYERLLTNGNITLFSPSDVPGLYDSFFTDYDTFKSLYEAAEKNVDIRKKSVPAIELFTSFIQERKDTGRVYLMNVDHSNDHSSFIKEVAPVRQSNLCLSGDTWITVQIDNGDIKDMQLRDVIHYKNPLRVMSRNIKNGKDEFKNIIASAQTGTNRKVMRITDEFGNSIICTPDHKVYTKNRGYVEAKNLVSTDILQQYKNTHIEIKDGKKRYVKN